MLSWIFGPVQESRVNVNLDDTAAGILVLERARVRWFLSVNENYLPNIAKEKKQRTYRSIKIGGEEIEFSDGFTDLHTSSYKEILNGNGFGLDEVRTSIETVANIRTTKSVGLKNDYHPFCKQINL